MILQANLEAMKTITDYDIQALVDNELEYETAKKIRTRINNSPDACNRYQELIKQKHLLQEWWKQYRQ